MDKELLEEILIELDVQISCSDLSYLDNLYCSGLAEGFRRAKEIIEEKVADYEPE